MTSILIGLATCDSNFVRSGGLLLRARCGVFSRGMMDLVGAVHGNLWASTGFKDSGCGAVNGRPSSSKALELRLAKYSAGQLAKPVRELGLGCLWCLSEARFGKLFLDPRGVNGDGLLFLDASGLVGERIIFGLGDETLLLLLAEAEVAEELPAEAERSNSPWSARLSSLPAVVGLELCWSALLLLSCMALLARLGLCPDPAADALALDRAPSCDKLPRFSKVARLFSMLPRFASRLESAVGCIPIRMVDSASCPSGADDVSRLALVAELCLLKSSVLRLFLLRRFFSDSALDSSDTRSPICNPESVSVPSDCLPSTGLQRTLGDLSRW
mmetsp:Transcript_13719/g.26043  ORF Transcript_13719/g.26043 Transcript_13719/m.26043 type:complete len:329 (+) Transcript_13719:435-1421(+)